MKRVSRVFVFLPNNVRVLLFLYIAIYLLVSLLYDNQRCLEKK
ncbi:hypothetical protein RV04_GL001847 [Enterococcus hermanniensis]|uniref:Uncharacterized protein n=1 Tax=Enterococcus hermanniensis TaxID=249189 RepID=A0A1L8TN25_9ENTE|nr:hypothetical protein RV04_GL001847 [Enterococcus hermanniensis]